MQYVRTCISYVYPVIAFLSSLAICIMSPLDAWSNNDNKNLLTKPFGSKPGSYDLLMRVSKPILNPGDTVHVDVYVSGYGYIVSECVYIMPSWSIFSKNDSKIAVGDLNYVEWDRLSELVCINNKSIYDHPDYTAKYDNYMISTEVNSRPGEKAPIHFDLKINPEADPGVYSIGFVLKYFNGETWYTKPSSVNITVRSFYQRHEIVVWLIGGIAAVISIISMSYPFIKCLWRWLLSFGNES